MPIRVRQPDGTFKVFEKKKETKEAATQTELPLCRDCGQTTVTGVGMKYCEECK